MCGKDDINDGKPVAGKHKIGQDFRVCVRPTAACTGEYSAASFKNVICGYRQLVIEGGDSTDILTKVTATLIGNKEAAGNAAFTSVIASGYFDGGKAVFVCGTGESVLNFKGRRLTTGFLHVSLGEENSSRALQETTTPERSKLVGDSPFATTIGIMSDSADVDGLAASAFRYRYPWWVELPSYCGCCCCDGRSSLTTVLW